MIQFLKINNYFWGFVFIPFKNFSLEDTIVVHMQEFPHLGSIKKTATCYCESTIITKKLSDIILITMLINIKS